MIPRPLLLTLTAALLAACQTTTITTASRVPLPAAYESAPTAAQADDISRWWQQWQDPVLDRLIARALAHNPDIAIARSRLQEARAIARLADADLGPTVGLGANAYRLDTNLQNPISADTRALLAQNPLAGNIRDNRLQKHADILGLGLSASWEPDIFGQKQSDADAARHAALATAEQTHAAQLLISAEIADQYHRARATEARKRAADTTITTLEQLARYIEARYQAGHTTAYEKDEIQSRLSAAKAKRSTLDAEKNAAVRAIAILCGDTPQHYRLPDSPRDTLAHPPAAPRGQTPQGLIERRPDLRARAAETQAYAAKLASAKADLLPRIKLDFLGQGILNIDGDHALKGWMSLLTAGIQVPIYTHGRIQANIDAADARLKTALLQYDRTLLQALADVDNAYQGEAALAEQEQHLSEALANAEQQAADAEKLYRYGNKTLAEALTARLNAVQTEEALIQNRLAHAQMLTALYKALGGGWIADSTPNP